MLSGSISVLASFNAGEGPPGNVVVSGNTLYGTDGGGTNGDGEVFSMPVAGGIPTMLASFDSTDAFQISFVSGDTLYGIASGGAIGNGAIYSLPTTGGTPKLLGSFDGADGTGPTDLILSGSTLYGTTAGNAISRTAVIFSLPVTGGTPTVLTSLNPNTQGIPEPDLNISGTTIYGSTGENEINSNVVFSLPTSGGTPTTLASFVGSGGSSSGPGNLILSGSTFYGTTAQDDSSDGVDVFSLPISGGTPTVLASLESLGIGYPGALALSGITLYGTTKTAGGVDGDGAIFSVPIAGGSATLMASFDGVNGMYPQDLVVSGNTLYGSTTVGGANNRGTVFSLPATAIVRGPVVTETPTAQIVDADDAATFTAYAAGDPSPTVQWYVEKAGADKFALISGATSTTYKITAADVSESGNEYKAIFTSSNGSTATNAVELTVLPLVADIAYGSYPSSVVVSGHTLYATFDNSGAGEIVSVPVTGGAPNVLASFNGHILGDLIVSGTTFYGISYPESDNDGAEIFSLPITGGTRTVLASFEGTTGFDLSNLVLSGSTLFGVVGSGGGAAEDIFSVPVTGGTSTTIASLVGLGGVTSLLISGDVLYGTASDGDDSGSIFSLPITGGTPTILAELTDAIGVFPGSLVVSGSTLFCSTSDEGPSGGGTVLSLPITGGTPTVMASVFGNAETPGHLAIIGDTLYGTTGAGSYVVFSLPTSGGTPAELASLDGYAGDLIAYGDTLYGTIPDGGPSENGAVFALPINLSLSTISLSSSHVPVYQGQHVTLTAAVAAAAGDEDGTPTGSVTFYDDGEAIGSAQPLINGTATITDTTLPIGSNSITATYSGDDSFASSITASALIATVRAVPPTIVSKTASVSTHGLTIAASVIGADTGSGGAAGLTYTWTAIQLPAGAKTPTFSVNGTNAASDVIARFSKDGEYVLQCEVKNAAGNDVTTDVSVTVSQKATSLKIEPHAAHIAKDGTLQFTGTVLDQFGHAMRTPQTLAYLVAAGPGSINSTGLFSATSVAGAVTIELEADGLTSTAGAVVG